MAPRRVEALGRIRIEVDLDGVWFLGNQADCYWPGGNKDRTDRKEAEIRAYSLATVSP